MRSVTVGLVFAGVAGVGCGSSPEPKPAEQVVVDDIEQPPATESPTPTEPPRPPKSDTTTTTFADLDGDGQKEHINVIGSLVRIGSVVTSHQAQQNFDVTIVDLDERTPDKELVLVERRDGDRWLHVFTYDGERVIASEPIALDGETAPATGDGMVTANGRTWRLDGGRMVPAPAAKPPQ